MNPICLRSLRLRLRTISSRLSIHSDGNGRVGRLLITLFLIEWKILPTPLLYLSVFLKPHAGSVLVTTKWSRARVQAR